MSKVVLTCDQCGKAQTYIAPAHVAASPERTATFGNARGWRIDREAELPDLCPTCKQWSNYP